MEAYKQGVNNDHIWEHGKGRGVSINQSLYILCSVEKSEIVGSIALADTRENRNNRAVLYTKGIVQWKMPSSAGFCQK